VACQGVLVLLGHRSLHVFASKTGQVLWTYGLPDQSEPLASTLALTKETLYFLSIHDEQVTVHAMNLQDGTVRWQVPLPVPPTSSWQYALGSLTLTDQALYVLQSALDETGYLVALRPQNGGLIWSATSAPYEHIIMASNQTLYLANPFQLDAYQTANGNRLWSQRIGGSGESVTSVLGSPQLGLFMTQNADSLCSLDLTTGTTSWCLHQAFSESEGTPFFIDTTTIDLISGEFDTIYVVDRQTGKVRTHFEVHALTEAITAL
jgi:outer membrane protein assembly factor BamB